MNQLEFAIRTFQYDPERTPQLVLEKAEISFEQAEFDLQCAQQKLDDLDDNAVYEFYSVDEVLVKREISKRTPKQIRLTPKFATDKETVLSRQALEAGEHVGRLRSWKEFAFGWAIRPKLEEDADHCKERLAAREDEVQEIHFAMLMGELVLDSRQRAIMNAMQHLWTYEPIDELIPEQVNWSVEGF